MKRLVVACGSGVATSTTIAERIKRKFESDGINCSVEAVDYKSIMSELPSTNIYVYIEQPDAEVIAEAERLNVDVYAGIPFLTSMGEDAIYEQIVESVKK